MSRNQAGAVLVFNPSHGVNMDLEENPRGKKRRKARKAGGKKRARKAGKRRAAKRSNPSHVAHSAPKKRGRRRMRARKASRRHSYARRRNPAFPRMMDVATWTAGGGLAYGAQYLIGKIPNMSVPVELGARAATGLALGIGSAFVSEKLAAGVFGAWGFQLPGLALAGYNYWQATKAAEKTADKLADASKKGTGGLTFRRAGMY